MRRPLTAANRPAMATATTARPIDLTADTPEAEAARARLRAVIARAASGDGVLIKPVLEGDKEQG